jgi:hypothetical protein
MEIYTSGSGKPLAAYLGFLDTTHACTSCTLVFPARIHDHT